MKIISATISAFIIFLNVYVISSQPRQADEWCGNFPNVPGVGTLWGHASCVMGDTIYVVGGSSSGTPTNQMYRYSISSNQWDGGANLPANRTGGDLVVASGKIYYIGGGNLTIAVASPEQYVYNPANGTWSAITNIPTPVTGNVAECYRDSLIYCMLGGWNTYETLIQVYNVRTNTWAQATQIPSGNGRRSFAGGILGNRLFVCAGWGGNFRNDFWVGTINPSNHLQITWAQRTNLAVATSRPGGTAIQGRFYVVIGEMEGGLACDSMAVWDTTTSAWSYKDGKPVRTSNLYGSVSSNITWCEGIPGVKIWVAGGSHQGQSVRPLDVYADTCLLGCTGPPPVGGINNNGIPLQYRLSQNYPNPFNPVTKISFEIPKDDNVKITVTDILGREVVTLVNEFKRAGYYDVLFDGVNYSSGVYFYRIETSGLVDTKKMVLLK